MGEARRRKKLDPSFGKVRSDELIAGRKESEWRLQLSLTKEEWKRFKPYFRFVKSSDDVDDTIDGLWVYEEPFGKLGVSYTGELANYIVPKLLLEDQL